jgi:EAL domain-containing protein (putative c-di-GMP-specific phosphodiesterase class I)
MVSASPRPSNGVQLRRADNNERFVAFAFAAADLMAEIDPEGRITYAAGAFRARLGQAPEAFIGRSVQSLITPADHETLDAALLLLSEKGRLAPLLIHLADAGRTQFALAGLMLAPAGCPVRLCLTFAVPPTLADLPQFASSHMFARAIQTQQRAQAPGGVGLIEVTSSSNGALLGEAVGSALHAVAPGALASEIAPGRFGLLSDGGPPGLAAICASLEAVLQKQSGITTVAVASRGLSLNAEGLTSIQAARALRQALNVFARDGAPGLDEAGFAGGLADYVNRATTHTRALHRVIRERRFELLFQPIVSLADRTLHHYEALLRPKPIPSCPFNNPQEFVMLVETLGLSDELDLAVADLASTAATSAATSVAFNLSSQSVQSPAFRGRLLALLSASPACQAGRLIVEMTETAEVENLAEAARTVAALRAIGVPFCLDDFGAGTADVRVLRAISADIVKLDGSYVAGVLQGGHDRAFVKGMIDIARAAGAEVVGERIETEAEAEALRVVGITYGQGWLFGHPAPLPATTVGDAPIARRQNGRRRGEKEQWG